MTTLIQPIRFPQTHYNCSRDTPTTVGNHVVPDNANVDYLVGDHVKNAIAYQRCINRLGGSYTEGPITWEAIYEDLFLPGRAVGMRNIVIPSFCGGKLLFGGNLLPTNNYNARGGVERSGARLIYEGDVATPYWIYRGKDFVIGPVSLEGIDLPNNSALNAATANYKTLADPSTGSLPEVGLQVESLNVSGCPTGFLTAVMKFVGWKTCINIANIGQNCDHLFFESAAADIFHTFFKCRNTQSICHKFGYVNFKHGSVGWDYQGGGDLFVDYADVETPDFTLLKVGAGHQTFGRYVINNFKFDNTCHEGQTADPVLLNLTNYDGNPRRIKLIGSLGDQVTCNPATAINAHTSTNGVQVGDRILIRTGRPELDALSTVSDEP